MQSKAPSAPASLPHAMLSEIFEQPEALARTLGHYLDRGTLTASSFNAVEKWVASRNRILIAASGSSRHAGLAAEVMIEDLSGIPVDVEYASEFALRDGMTPKDSVVAVISQSGETADTLAAMRRAEASGAQILAITNVERSSMAHEATVSLPTYAGIEKAIPATKSFTTQLAVAYLVAICAGTSTGMLDQAAVAGKLHELDSLSSLLSEQLAKWSLEIEQIATVYRHAESFLYLGRGVHYAIAREGALKLKESAYVHAEGYPTGELKHGPNAMVGDDVPLVVLATVDTLHAGSVTRYQKTLQLLRDMKKQGASVFAIVNRGDDEARRLVTHAVEVTPTSEYLLPVIEVVPLQMFAYYCALQRNIDVDHPRNLVKSVVRE